MYGVIKIMLEASIECRACARVLKELGVRSLKLNVGGQTGWPDRMFMVPGGRPLFIEFKRPGEEPRPKQQHIHKILRHNRYDIQVYDTVDGAFQAVAAAVAAARVPAAGR